MDLTNDSTRSGANSRRAVAGKEPAKKTPAKVPAGFATAVDLDTQRGKDVQAYGAPIKLLNARKYEEARQLLTDLLNAPTIEVAHTARMRLLMLQAHSDQRKQ